MNRIGLVTLLLVSFSLPSFAAPPQADAGKPSRLQQSVTGPTRKMNEALAAGATAVISLQPVPPKTVPASNYPTGTAIMNETIYLGSVPARVWLEVRATGWAPEQLCAAQVKVDAADQDLDGGGYSGQTATCGGVPVAGAGDIFPAIIPCNTTIDCRSSTSGRTSSCSSGEPTTCMERPAYFPPGGKVCNIAFQDTCNPNWMGTGVNNIPAVDNTVIFPRFYVAINDEGGFIDSGPSYMGTLVLDVPSNAKGHYNIDINNDETLLFNGNPAPNNQIPIAELRPAVIAVDTCVSHMDCDDGDICTVDSCQGGCCEHGPIAGWNPATECCNPANAGQAPIPPSTSCKIGGCTMGGSSGSPTYIFVEDGTACEVGDPCYSDGLCFNGQCFGEQYEGSECPKPRFVSFDVSTGPVRAYRVRLVSLHHPDPPYTRGITGDFSAYEGEARWVGPHGTYVESTADSTPVYSSVVQCQPYYQNWNALDLLHVTGAEIVPSSIYEVQSIAQGLDVNVESNYSAPITIKTARWADVSIPYSPPNATAQPNAGDHAALVTKFRSADGAISKPRALLSGDMMTGIPNLQNDIGFVEISLAVDAFRGFPYPYAGPQSCP